MILYAVNPETISALIAGGGTAIAMAPGVWRLESAEAIRPGAGYVILPTPDASIEAIAAAKKAEIAAARWETETGGVDWVQPSTGVTHRLRTDRDARAILTDSGMEARASPGHREPTWKTANGEFIALENTDVISAAYAVNDWARFCFVAEALLIQQIDAALAANDRTAILNIKW